MPERIEVEAPKSEPEKHSSLADNLTQQFFRTLSNVIGYYFPLKDIDRSEQLRLNLELNLEKATESLKQKFNFPNIIIDLWSDDHEMTLPENPGSTILMGEIRPINIQYEPPKVEPVQDYEAGEIINRMEIVTEDNFEIKKWRIGLFPIVVSTDANPVKFDTIWSRLRDNPVFTDLINRYPSVFFVLAPSIIGGLIDSIRNKPVSRRTVLIGMLAGSAIGFGGNLRTRELLYRDKSSQHLLIDRNELNNFDNELIAILDNYDDFRVKARDHIMTLNMLSLSGLDYDEIDTLQTSFANGHEDILNLVQEPDTQNSEEFLERQIEDIFDKYLELFRKYEGSGKDYKVVIYEFLSSYLLMFRPQLMRVNKNVAHNSLQYYRSRVGESDVKSAFLTLILKLESMNETFENNNDTQAQELLHNTLSSLKDQLINDVNGVTSATFDLGLAGDSANIGETVELFNIGYDFSPSGLFAGYST